VLKDVKIIIIIPPCDPDSQDDELDSVLPPIDLHQPTDCTCFNLPINPVCPDGHSYTPNNGRSAQW
jgi:hypothetical protein